MKSATFVLALLLVAAPLGAAVAQDFMTYEGTDTMREAGPGGEKKTVNGIDFWMSGTPPKPFQILGSITDHRHSNGIWGMISMSNLDGDLVKLTKKAGGDAVMLAMAQDEVTGVSGGGTNFGSANCSTMFNMTSCDGSTFGGGSATVIKERDSKYWVVKYIDVPPGNVALTPGNGTAGAFGPGTTPVNVSAPGGDKAATNAALDAAGKAAAACNAQVDAMPESAPLKAKLPNFGQETVEQLTDASFATDEQVAALKLTYPRHQACQIGSENQIRKVFPASDMAFIDTDHQIDDAYADLENKKINWGDFLRKRKSILDNFTRAIMTQLKVAGLL
jgi:hypothetical protein